MSGQEKKNAYGIDEAADDKRFAVFMTVIVVFLALGALLVVGVLVYEVNTPDERPEAPPKYSLPGFAPPERPAAP